MTRKPTHYRGSYDVRSRRLVAAARANPNTRCWRCGRRLDEHEPHRNGKQAKWTAGHVKDGEVGGLLLPEASTCNYTAGAELGGQRFAATKAAPRTSRSW